MEFRGQKPRNARVLVPWNDWLGRSFPAVRGDSDCSTAEAPIRHLLLGPRQDDDFFGFVVAPEEEVGVGKPKEEETGCCSMNTSVPSLQNATAPFADVVPGVFRQPTDSVSVRSNRISNTRMPPIRDLEKPAQILISNPRLERKRALSMTIRER